MREIDCVVMDPVVALQKAWHSGNALNTGVSLERNLRNEQDEEEPHRDSSTAHGTILNAPVSD